MRPDQIAHAEAQRRGSRSVSPRFQSAADIKKGILDQAVANLKTSGLHAEANRLLDALKQTEEHAADAHQIANALSEQAFFDAATATAAADAANARLEQQTWEAERAARDAADNKFLTSQHARGGNPNVEFLLNVADAAAVHEGVDLSLAEAADRSRVIAAATSANEIRQSVMNEGWKASSHLSRKYEDGPPAVDPAKAMTHAASVKSLSETQRMKDALLADSPAADMSKLSHSVKQRVADAQEFRIQELQHGVRNPSQR
jgi:hypothetical protein